MTLHLQAETRPAPAPQERGPAACALPGPRVILAGPAVAAVTVLVALVAIDAAGVSLRDPGGVTLRRLLTTAVLVLVLAGLDIAVRAARRSAGWWPSWPALQAVRRERWTLRRGLAVAGAVLAFYVTYLAYRNLKSVVPLLRPDDLFDRQLADADRFLFFGHDPAVLLHDLWGVAAATGSSSRPCTCSSSSSSRPRWRPRSSSCRTSGKGFLFVTAMSLNWVLGAAS